MFSATANSPVPISRRPLAGTFPPFPYPLPAAEHPGVLLRRRQPFLRPSEGHSGERSGGGAGRPPPHARPAGQGGTDCGGHGEQPAPESGFGGEKSWLRVRVRAADGWTWKCLEVGGRGLEEMYFVPRSVDLRSLDLAISFLIAAENGQSASLSSSPGPAPRRLAHAASADPGGPPTQRPPQPRPSGADRQPALRVPAGEWGRRDAGDSSRRLTGSRRSGSGPSRSSAGSAVPGRRHSLHPVRTRRLCRRLILPAAALVLLVTAALRTCTWANIFVS